MPGDQVVQKRFSGRRKAAAVIGVAIAVMMAGAIAWLSIVTVDLTPHLPRIKAMVEQRVAGKFDAERLTIKFLPSPDIKMSGVETRMDGERIFGARFVHLRISLLPLIIGHLNIKDIELEGAGAYIKRDADGVVNISKFIRVSKEKREKRLKLFSLSFELMDITDTHMEISDRMPAEPVDFDITDIKAIVRKTPQGVILKANAQLAPDTRLTFSGMETPEGVEGKGSLTALRLERLGPYLRERSPEASLTGTLDLDFIYTGTSVKEFKGILKYDSLSVTMPDLLSERLSAKNGSAAVRLLPDAPGGPELTIRGIKLDLGDLSVLGSLKVAGSRGDRSYTLDLSTTPVTVKRLMELASARYAARVKDVTPLGGSVTINRLTVSRPISAPGEVRPDRLQGITLDARLDALNLGYAKLKKPVEDVSASVSLKDKVLKISSMTGRYGKARLTGLEASVTGLAGEPSYKLTADATVDVNEALHMVSGLMKEQGPTALLLSRSEAQGELQVKAEASGPLQANLSGVAYSARAELNGGSFSYRGLPLKAKSINARAEFDQKDIKSMTLSATEGSSTLEFTGSVKSYRERAPDMRLSATGKITAASLKSLVAGSSFENETGFEGDILYDIKAHGTPAAPTAEVKMDAGGAYIQYRNILDKPPGVRLAFGLSASMENKRYDIKKASLDFGRGSSVSASGSAASKMRSYDISIGADKMLISDFSLLTGYLDKEFASAGVIAFKLNAAKEARKPAAYKGEAQMANARFKPASMPKPVDDLDAHASFTGNAASIVIDNLSVGRTAGTAIFDIPDIKRRTINFEMNFPSLYSDDLLAKKKKKEETAGEPVKKEPKKIPGPEIGKKRPSINGRGTIRVAKGEFWGQPFKDLSADVNMEDHITHFDPITMELDNGKVSGKVAYHMSSSDKRLFDSRFKLTGLDLNTMLLGFGAKKEYLTGSLNATVDLSGERGARSFSAGLGGKASLRAKGGRMWKIPVLVDIFTIVNILSLDELLQKGLPYKDISGDFEMTGGVATTRNITMNSDSMRMSAIGKLNFPDGRMDMVLGLHPFVTIDKIISNIPLAGWLITGKEESTVSMYFSIKGPFKKRTVTPMPIEGLAKGVLGILQRVLEAPIDILKGEIPGEQEKKMMKPREAQ